MKKEQQRLLELLKEIHGLCTENKIQYFLSPRTAYYVSRYGELPENVNDNEIVMTIPNVRKFMKVFQESHLENRVLESMDNSGHYPGLSLRYVDKSTYFVNIFQGTNYDCPGLAVCIRPLRGKVVPQSRSQETAALEMGWLQNCYMYGIKSKGKWIFYGAAVRCMMVIGRRRLSKKIFALLMKACDNPKTGLYLIRRWDKDMFLEKKLFRKKKTINMQGFRFPVPSNSKLYMKELPKAWKTKTVERGGKTCMDNVYGVNVPYEEAEKIMPRQGKFFRRRRRHYKRIKTSTEARKYYLSAWDIANQSGEKFRLKEYYEPRKERILNLHEAKDYRELAKELMPYEKGMRKYLRTGYRIVFDQQIYEIYLETLAAVGKNELKERIQGMKE